MQRAIPPAVCAILILCACLVACTDTTDGTDPPILSDPGNVDDVGDDDDAADPYNLFAEYTDPTERGPYAVGVRTLYPVDESRFEPVGRRKRVLPLEVWYPSSGAGGTVNTMPDMFGPAPDWAIDLLASVYGDYFETLWSIETTALRGAEVLDAGARFPVILFSHGLTAIRFQNYTLCEHLASHGFIVVAPDHYGNAVVTIPPDGDVILFNPVSAVSSYFARTDDVAFLYEYLAKLDDDPADPLYGKLDLSRFSVTGHSFGGVTSLFAGATLPQVYSIAPINPAWIDEFPADFDKPYLAILAEDDTVVGMFNEYMQEIYAGLASARKVQILMHDAGHYSATDACDIVPDVLRTPAFGCGGDRIPYALANEISNAYITAFFRAVVTDDDRYADYLRANHYEGSIDLAVDWR